jgi:hypothetical protein
MFRDQKQPLLKSPRVAPEESTFYPLPALFKLIGLAPFKKVSCLLLFVLPLSQMHYKSHQFEALAPEKVCT